MFLDHFFPDHAFINLRDSISLFVRGEGGDPDAMTRIVSVDQLHENCVVEIVMSANAEEAVDKVSPHVLNVHSYKSPTFCDYCGQMLFGLVRQGLQCNMCNYNFHKRCAYKVPNNCSHKVKAPYLHGEKSLSTGSSTGSTTSTHLSTGTGCSVDVPQRRPRSNSGSGPSLAEDDTDSGYGGASRSRSGVSQCSGSSGRPAWIDRALASADRPKVPHRFAVHSYKKPTVCSHCKKLLVGLFRQGLQCKDCKFNAHRTCVGKVEDNCSSEILEEIIRGEPTVDNGQKGQEEPATAMVNPGEDASPRLSELDAKVTVSPADSSSSGDSSNIPLQRIFMSVRKSAKDREPESLLAGWVIYFTSKNKQRQVRFWNVNSRFLRIFESDRNSGGSCIEQIPLSSVLDVRESKEAKKNGHYFEVEVDGKGTYFVGERIHTVEDSCLFKIRDSAPEAVFAKRSQATFAQALKVAITRRTAEGWFEALLRAFRPVGREVSVPIAPSPELDEKNADISTLYQVFPDEVLGSGQFGIVYAGVHRKKGYCIAIKVIDKHRFSSKHQAALRNEVVILQSIKHLGVVQLDRMFETPDRVFIIMEKMDSDMLEMVLSSPKGRLSERTARFLVAQILYALQHLHSKQIAHCDLKPENVLLARGAADGFPQAKLCDFGFARIIGESSFRKTVVGTPAYLAPEVLKNKGYNRTLDLWSVGVVIYVTLSGTFPFNEEEDIQDQIENADFLYPKALWKDISPESIALINALLQVDSRKRLSAAKSLNHPWLAKKQLWDDLRALEKSLNCRYMTHEAEDAYWQGKLGKGAMPSRTEELPDEPK